MDVDLKWLSKLWDHYIENIIRVDFYDYQIELTDELLKLPQYADITQTRQSGKSWIIGVIAYFLMFYLKWHIILAAPGLDQTTHIMETVDEIATYYKKYKGIKHPVHRTQKIKIEGRGSIKAITGDPKGKVDGNRAHLLILDEKQDLEKDHVTSKITPFTSFFNGLIWSLGIGGDPLSWGEHSREESSLPGNLLWNCPWQRVVIDKPNYQKTVDQHKRSQFPQMFKANFECEQLDMSAYILVPKMTPYTKLPEGNRIIRVNFDFGAIDKTIGTVTYRFPYQGNDPDGLDQYYINEWFVINGDYSIQTHEIEKWLKTGVDYNQVYGEANGVGRPVIDYLNSRGLEITPITIDPQMKTDCAHKVANLASRDKIKYNEGHEYASVFYNDITKLRYRMTTVRDVKVDHSDFYSSLILGLIEGPRIRISM